MAWRGVAFAVLPLVDALLSTPHTYRLTNPQMTPPPKIRPLWRHYYQNTQGLIFVVDSNDRDRVDAGALMNHGLAGWLCLLNSVVNALTNVPQPTN